MKRSNSAGLLILSVVWIMVSFVWFRTAQNPTMGSIWLAFGIVELVISVILLFIEHKHR